MEEHQWASPLWAKSVCPVKGENARDLRYTYPDWGNAGPAIAAPSHHTDDLHLEGLWSQPSGFPSSSSFTTSKDVQKKFPLRAACQYSYPLLQPQRSYCRDSVEQSLVGNCLAVAQMGGESVVVHVDPSRDTQQAVVASRLVPGSYYQKDELTKDAFYHLEKWNDVLVDQHVYQIVSKSLHNDVHVLVRSPTTVHLAGLGQTHSTKDKVGTLGGSLTSDAALSSVLPGLWSLVTVKGEVTLHDAEVRKPLWRAHYRGRKKVKKKPASAFRCDFGRHPLNIFVGDESSLCLYDTRVQPNLNRPLFDKKKVKDCVPFHEEICSFVPAYDQPHLYLIMDESVYVLDDRQSKTPLMHWRHMLPGRPSLSTLSRLDSLEILMLSCTQNKEVCMIASEWESERQQCHGVGVPRHFPTLRDTAAFAHSHSLWFTNQVQERLEDSTWLGTASLPHPAEKANLLFLSLHSTGDIFSHSFQTLNTKITSAITSEDNQGKAILSKWETDVLEASVHNWSSQNAKFFDVTGFFHQDLNKPSSKHAEDLLIGLPEINVHHLNASTDQVETKGSSKTGKDTQIATNYKKGAKTHGEKISKGKKSTICNEKESQKDISHIWNLKDHIRKCRSQWASKSSRFAAWNKSLMESYVTDPSVNPSEDLPVHLSDSTTEDILNKFLPRDIIANLKIDKIKNCEDFLSLKIASLWLDESGSSIKNEEDETEGHGTSDGRLSKLIGIQSSTRRRGFQYHTAPVDLFEVSAKLSTAGQHPGKGDHSPESSAHPTRPEAEGGEKVPSKSKQTLKKAKKRKRVDGF
ncbi:TATA box-binding protein-associated factor, RNA polymerase I, subunit C [Chionoecetes opilio]|uniref:TATA box-binding protein-associated factor, RNA polymerase I, subunit C n=1 Tax=Chionoecetes opilio TaxID=41210 RepID=A0A8J4YTH2_CHIOP|nr:TATA box-binding protein-associated factor, RNA polymerase I, subunit C [Chionoecetes opilio]